MQNDNNLKFEFSEITQGQVAEEIKKLDDLDVLVINALRIEEHYSHFNLDQALEFIKLI